MTFKNLIVWQKSVELAKQIYLLTQQFPKTETYGLTSQIQRCAVSIPSNIAEGHSRNNRKEYIQFLGVAYGSSAELETQVIIAESIYSDLDYCSVKALLLEVQKMIGGLIKSLKN